MYGCEAACLTGTDAAQAKLTRLEGQLAARDTGQRADGEQLAELARQLAAEKAARKEESGRLTSQLEAASAAAAKMSSTSEAATRSNGEEGREKELMQKLAVEQAAVTRLEAEVRRLRA